MDLQDLSQDFVRVLFLGENGPFKGLLRAPFESRGNTLVVGHKEANSLKRLYFYHLRNLSYQWILLHYVWFDIKMLTDDTQHRNKSECLELITTVQSYRHTFFVISLFSVQTTAHYSFKSSHFKITVQNKKKKL